MLQESEGCTKSSQSGFSDILSRHRENLFVFFVSFWLSGASSVMINLSPYNEFGHSHRAQECEPAAHQAEAALLSVLTTTPLSPLTFLCNGAQCGNRTSKVVIANRVLKEDSIKKQTYV